MNISKAAMLLWAIAVSTTAALAQTKVTDSELKKNATPITGSLNYINRIQPVTYQYDTKQFNQLKLPAGLQYGLTAESVESVLPGVVNTESRLYPAGKNSYRSAEIKTVDMQKLIPVLLGAIQEQQAQIDSLKGQLKLLKSNSTPAD